MGSMPQSERDQVSSGDVSSFAALGRRQIVARDQQPQTPGMDLEAQRGVELQRLTVDAGEGLAGSRPHLELIRGELVPVPAPPALPQRREGDHCCGLFPRSGGDGDDAELPGVEPSAL